MYQKNLRHYVMWRSCSTLSRCTVSLESRLLDLHRPIQQPQLTTFDQQAVFKNVRAMSSTCVATRGKITSGSATHYLPCRYNGTSGNLNFHATRQVVLENIDSLWNFSSTCDVTTSGFTVAVFVLPVEGGIWRHWAPAASYKIQVDLKTWKESLKFSRPTQPEIWLLPV